MKIRIYIEYDSESDKTILKSDKSFKHCTFLQKADILMDSVFLIKDMYSKNIDKWLKSKKM